MSQTANATLDIARKTQIYVSTVLPEHTGKVRPHFRVYHVVLANIPLHMVPYPLQRAKNASWDQPRVSQQQTALISVHASLAGINPVKIFAFSALLENTRALTVHKIASHVKQANIRCIQDPPCASLVQKTPTQK